MIRIGNLRKLCILCVEISCAVISINDFPGINCHALTIIEFLLISERIHTLFGSAKALTHCTCLYLHVPDPYWGYCSGLTSSR